MKEFESYKRLKQPPIFKRPPQPVPPILEVMKKHIKKDGK